LLHALADVSCPRAVRGNKLSIRSLLSSVSRGIGRQMRTCPRRRRSSTACSHTRCRVPAAGVPRPSPQASPPTPPGCPAPAPGQRALVVQGDQRPWPASIAAAVRHGLRISRSSRSNCLLREMSELALLCHTLCRNSSTLVC
jgi:hypothetical protein